MLIRSQSKQDLINLDNIDIISVYGGDIMAFNGTTARLVLGSYATSEIAKSVLDDIERAYQLCGVYEMPQDSEVE